MRLVDKLRFISILIELRLIVIIVENFITLMQNFLRFRYIELLKNLNMISKKNSQVK